MDTFMPDGEVKVDRSKLKQVAEDMLGFVQKEQAEEEIPRYVIALKGDDSLNDVLPMTEDKRITPVLLPHNEIVDLYREIWAHHPDVASFILSAITEDDLDKRKKNIEEAVKMTYIVLKRSRMLRQGIRDGFYYGTSLLKEAQEKELSKITYRKEDGSFREGELDANTYDYEFNMMMDWYDELEKKMVEEKVRRIRAAMQD